LNSLAIVSHRRDEGGVVEEATDHVISRAVLLVILMKVL
jgi:hypothetical protein